MLIETFWNSHPADIWSLWSNFFAYNHSLKSYKRINLHTYRKGMVAYWKAVWSSGEELFGLLKVENIGGKYISDFPIYCLARDIWVSKAASPGKRGEQSRFAASYYLVGLAKVAKVAKLHSGVWSKGERVSISCAILTYAYFLPRPKNSSDFGHF